MRVHSRDLRRGDIVRRPGKPDIEIRSCDRLEYQTIEEGLVRCRSKKSMRGVFAPHQGASIIRDGEELR